MTTPRQRSAHLAAVAPLVLLAATACAHNAPQAPHKTAPQPPVVARASVDKAVATTGDIITYTVEVDHAANVPVQIPEPGAAIAGLRVIDSGRKPVKKRHGRVIERRWYKLRADLVGSYVLPPVRVRYEATPAAKATATPAGKASPQSAAATQPSSAATTKPQATTPAHQPQSPGAKPTTAPSRSATASPASPTPPAGSQHVGQAAGAAAAAPGSPASGATGAPGSAALGAAAAPGSATTAAQSAAAARAGAQAAKLAASAKPPAGETRTPPDEVATSEIFIEVKSVLPKNGSAKDIRDIKPVRPLPHPARWPYVAGGAVLLLLLGLGGLLWWRRHNREIALPSSPPHELAFAALDSLRQTDFTDPVAVRRYYFHISNVIRSYVEGRFSVNATDLTTEEIFAQLEDLNDLAEAQQQTLRTFLLATDAVKFADHRPSTQEIEAVYEGALGFVEATVPPPPTTQEEERADAA